MSIKKINCHVIKTTDTIEKLINKSFVRFQYTNALNLSTSYIRWYLCDNTNPYKSCDLCDYTIDVDEVYKLKFNLSICGAFINTLEEDTKIEAVNKQNLDCEELIKLDSCIDKIDELFFTVMYLIGILLVEPFRFVKRKQQKKRVMRYCFDFEDCDICRFSSRKEINMDPEDINNNALEYAEIVKTLSYFCEYSDTILIRAMMHKYNNKISDHVFTCFERKFYDLKNFYFECKCKKIINIETIKDKRVISFDEAAEKCCGWHIAILNSLTIIMCFEKFLTKVKILNFCRDADPDFIRIIQRFRIKS